MKEVDDVLGGEAAWKNVDSTEGILKQRQGSLYLLHCTKYEQKIKYSIKDFVSVIHI